MGENNYRIVITAEDGTTKEYKISIRRNAKVSDEEKETVIETEKEDKFNSKILIVGVFIIVIAFTLVVISLIKHKRK